MAHHRPDLTNKKATFVYFARAYPSGLIKIGYSWSPNGRAHSLAAQLGEGVSLLFTTPGNHVQEKGFHKRFAAYRSHGEWFHESGTLHDFLREKGFAGARVVIEKQVVHLLGPTRLVTVLEPYAPDLPDYQPRTVGYARVSTEDQDLSMQLAKLRDSKCDVIFQEKISAVSAKRPQWSLLLKFLEPGDTLVVYAYNRISRDLKQLLTFVDDMKSFGVKLLSTSEPHINPYTTNGRLLVSVTGAVDENERGRIRDRTKDGMAECRRKGMYLGRPRKVDDKMAKEMRRDRKTMTAAQIAKKHKVSEGTVNKYAPRAA